MLILTLVAGIALSPPAAVQAASPASDLCVQVGQTAGFVGDRLVTAVAVALAESGCNPAATGTNGPTSGCPSGSRDRGLWQINDCYHPGVSDTCAYDGQCNADAAFQISSSGTTWTPWTTFRTGRYRDFLAQAQFALHRLLNRNFNPVGAADLLARRGDSGNLYIYYGGQSGGLAGPPKLVGNWAAFDDIVPVGDFDQDGYADVVARRADSGNLYLYPGNGAGGFFAGVLIGNWSRFTSITGAGDWDGDGNVDLVGRSKTGGWLYLYRGNGSGGLLYPGEVLSASNWNVFSQVVGAGDMNRDRSPDLLARRSDSGNLYLYRGNGGGLGSATLLGNWSAFNRIIGAGDWNHDGKIDVVSCNTANGMLYLDRGNGAGGISSRVVLHTSNWNAFDSMT